MMRQRDAIAKAVIEIGEPITAREAADYAEAKGWVDAPIQCPNVRAAEGVDPNFRITIRRIDKPLGDDMKRGARIFWARLTNTDEWRDISPFAPAAVTLRRV